MKTSGRRWLSLLLTIVMLTGVCSVPIYAEKASGDWNIGFRATVSVTDDNGDAILGGGPDECRDWWRGLPQDINNYFVMSTAGRWGWNYTLAKEDLPANVDFDYGIDPVEISQITLAEALKNTETIDGGRYTKVQLYYFNGTDWTAITPAAGNGYAINDDGTVSLNWSNPSRTDTLSGIPDGTKLDLIDINLGERYVSDKFRVRILDANENGGCWTQVAIDEILMYGTEADDDGITANGDAYLNALGEKAAAEAKKLANEATVSKAKGLIAKMASASRKAVLTEEIQALEANPWTNLATNATVTDASATTSAAMLNDGDTAGDSDHSWHLNANTPEENAWFRYSYGKQVKINRIELGIRNVENAITQADVYAINGETETKVGSYDLKTQYGRVPWNYLYTDGSSFKEEAKSALETEGCIKYADVFWSDFGVIDIPSGVTCDGIKVVVKEVMDGFSTHEAQCSECLTWGTEEKTAAVDYDDYNIGFEAEVSVKDLSGIGVSAGLNGGYGYSWWRTGVQDINNYFVHGTAGMWTYNYTINPDKLPVNVDFDYGLNPANIGKITLASAVGSDTEVNKGRYTKIKLYYFNGNDWTLISPQAASGYTVNTDGSISLDWANKTRRENAEGGRVDFLDIKLGTRVVSDKIRVQILEATGSGDCWGEFAIEEILMYGVAASQDDITSGGTAFVNALAEKAVTEASQMADAATIAKAKALVEKMSDADRKATLKAQIAALEQKPWVNLALDATASDGVNGTGVANLNDGNTDGTSDKTWKMPGDTAEDKSWFQYDYGKEVTINRIDLGARFTENAITKVDVYASLNETETKVGTYTLASSRVPEKRFYKTEEDFSKEAFEYFKDSSLLNTEGEVQYSEFSSIVLESSVVCDKLKVVVQGVNSGFRTADKTEFNDAPVEAHCTECRTWGTVGENASYNYTDSNMAFKMPVSMYDTAGNEVSASDVDGYRNLSTEYLTDFAIYEADWYDTALDYTKLPFYIEIDYQGKMPEINRVMLSSTRNNRVGGLVKSGKVQMFDGTAWKDVSLAGTQDEGITVSDSVKFTLDWSKPSIYDQADNDYKAYNHMNIKFAEPTLGFKLRLLVLEAGNDSGTFHIDELMTWGWIPNQADIAGRKDAESILSKQNTYLLDLAFTNPTTANVQAATEIINKMEASDKALYTKALGKLGVWDKVKASGSAGSGNYPDGLTDGKFSDASQRWDSASTTIDERSWVQINFEKPTLVSKLRLAERYYPSSVTKVNVYAKVGETLIPVYLNQTLGFANAPEMIWYTSNTGTQFDVWAKKAYTDNKMLRSDGNELETAAWVVLDFPSDIACDAIRVQVLDAERGWGGYGVAEMEAIGRTAVGTNVFATESAVKCTDGSKPANLAEVKTNGGYLVANLGNPSATATQKATMLVVYYQDNAVVASDSKEVVLTSKGYSSEQKLNLDFSGLRSNCDMIRCYIWSEIGSDTTARGTNTAIELK